MRYIELGKVGLIINYKDWGFGISIWGNGYDANQFWQVTIQVLCFAIEIPLKR